MSNAIAQSANGLALPGIGGNEITSEKIDEIILNNASRSVKGVTRERLMLNYGKLKSAVCDVVRSLMGQSKGRVSDELETLIDGRISVFVTANINRVNTANVVSFNRAFGHDARNLAVVENVQVKGRNSLSLKEQSFGMTLLMNRAEARLAKFQLDTKNYTREKEADLQKAINELRITKAHIEASLKLIEDAKKEEAKSTE